MPFVKLGPFAREVQSEHSWSFKTVLQVVLLFLQHVVSNASPLGFRLR